ncbi:NAD(P)-binding protein [Schizophyllum commune Loenen D]|nr:NAD(P)-binding protein [Schizophyllum commune Loenen D]
MARQTGKTILITGLVSIRRRSSDLPQNRSAVNLVFILVRCSSGIGEALAREAHAKGYHVFATARAVEALSELAALGIMTLPLDVTSDESVEALKDAVSEITGGRLSVLINNAMFDTNVFGVMRMVDAFAPLLVADGDARILNVGSMAGTIPFPFESAYAASKAAVHSYSEALRVELAPLGVQVINLCSGGVSTNAAKEKSSLMFAENSLFRPFEHEMQAAHESANNTNAMAPELYAKEVIDQSDVHGLMDGEKGGTSVGTIV